MEVQAVQHFQVVQVGGQGDRREPLQVINRAVWVPAFADARLYLFNVALADRLHGPVPQRCELREVPIGVPGDVHELVEEGVAQEEQAIVIGCLERPVMPDINWHSKLHAGE